MNIKMTIQGENRIKEAIDKYERSINKRVPVEVLIALAGQIEREVKDVMRGGIAHGTGRLWRSVRRKPRAGVENLGRIKRISIGTNVKYAPYLELGTGLWGPNRAKYEIKPKRPGGVLHWHSRATVLKSGKSATFGSYHSLDKSGGGAQVGGKGPRYKHKKLGSATAGFAKKVMHPGIAPRRFFGKAVERILPRVPRILSEETQRILKETKRGGRA